MLSAAEQNESEFRGCDPGPGHRAQVSETAGRTQLLLPVATSGWLFVHVSLLRPDTVVHISGGA